MTEEKYNLVDAPWICLLSKKGHVTKAGLKKVFLEAQNYLDLGGEIRLQDMAVLRLLIAISVTILYRYDEKGQKNNIQNWEEALDRFRRIWRMGKFNQASVEEYFSKWHDSFELFDDERPFFQKSLKWLEWKNDKEVPNGKKPVYNSGVYMNWLPAAAMNARIQMSNNKPRTPFKDLYGKTTEELDYDEAARWLLFYNAYSDCTVGKRQHFKGPDGKEVSANASMTLPSRGALVTPVGHNLFETIMLNSVLFDPHRYDCYESILPFWEREKESIEICQNMTIPFDLPRMYTQQARRITLVRSNGKISGAYVSAGESYDSSLLWMEPAFMMETKKDKDTKELITVPKQFGNDTDIWREIDHIAGDQGASIVKWIDILQGEDDLFLEEDVIPFRVTGISYGSMNCGIQRMVEDSIILSRQFLKDTELQYDATQEIENINKIKDLIYIFGNNCGKCMGFSKSDSRTGKDLSKQYLDAIGAVFRRFLSGDTDLQELKKYEFKLAKDVTNDYVENNLEALLRGKPGDDGMFFGKAEMLFSSKLSKLERK